MPLFLPPAVAQQTNRNNLPRPLLLPGRRPPSQRTPSPRSRTRMSTTLEGLEGTRGQVVIVLLGQAMSIARAYPTEAAPGRSGPNFRRSPSRVARLKECKVKVASGPCFAHESELSCRLVCRSGTNRHGKTEIERPYRILGSSSINS
jgi:hypothetical protein